MSQRQCPSREQLSGYALGTLPVPQAEEVTEHIAACTDCEDTLHNLGLTSDGLIARIQSPSAAEPFVGEAACLKVVRELEVPRSAGEAAVARAGDADVRPPSGSSQP
ncbi:MAG: zf-HC2 domain-containing protein, partial [Planctomycetia bacterium]|nr:zf-HC2 domain-containing protein [Planctomycetia bacterium]